LFSFLSPLSKNLNYPAIPRRLFPVRSGFKTSDAKIRDYRGSCDLFRVNGKMIRLNGYIWGLNGMGAIDSIMKSYQWAVWADQGVRPLR